LSSLPRQPEGSKIGLPEWRYYRSTVKKLGWLGRRPGLASFSHDVRIQSLFLHSLDRQGKEPSVPSQQLVLPSTVVGSYGIPLFTHSLVDCGATSDAFVDHDWALRNKFTLVPLACSLNLIVADGHFSSNGAITHSTDLRLSIGSHTETIRCLVTKLGRYQLILGKPWLNTHNPLVNWRDDLVPFNSVEVEHTSIGKRLNLDVAKQV
jgi:hypothetical protein